MVSERSLILTRSVFSVVADLVLSGCGAELTLPLRVTGAS